MLNYLCEFCSSLHSAFSVLNANVRTLSSYVESLKRHNSYFMAHRCTWFFTRTDETLHKINSTILLHFLTSGHSTNVPYLQITDKSERTDRNRNCGLLSLSFYFCFIFSKVIAWYREVIWVRKDLIGFFYVS